MPVSVSNAIAMRVVRHEIDDWMHAIANDASSFARRAGNLNGGAKSQFDASVSVDATQSRMSQATRMQHPTAFAIREDVDAWSKQLEPILAAHQPLADAFTGMSQTLKAVIRHSPASGTEEQLVAKRAAFGAAARQAADLIDERWWTRDAFTSKVTISNKHLGNRTLDLVNDNKVAWTEEMHAARRPKTPWSSPVATAPVSQTKLTLEQQETLARLQAQSDTELAASRAAQARLLAEMREMSGGIARVPDPGSAVPMHNGQPDTVTNVITDLAKEIDPRHAVAVAASKGIGTFMKWAGEKRPGAQNPVDDLLAGFD